MKDIIITAGGKNITPSEIENQLKFSPYISDAVVIGDKRKFLSCLVMIDHDNVSKHAQDNNVPFTDFTSLCRAREVQDLIWTEIERVNAELRAGRDDQEVPADRAAAHGRGRRAHPDHEAQAQVRQRKIQDDDRRHVRRRKLEERNARNDQGR